MHGFEIAMLDSVTKEIATTKTSALIGLIFTRNPIRTMRTMGPARWFVYVLFLQHVAAATKHQGYGTVKYMIVVLAGIWPMLSVLSLGKACYELANPRMRHFWDKTEHGHDLHTLDEAVGGLRSVAVDGPQELEPVAVIVDSTAELSEVPREETA